MLQAMVIDIKGYTDGRNPIVMVVSGDATCRVIVFGFMVDDKFTFQRSVDAYDMFPLDERLTTRRYPELFQERMEAQLRTLATAIQDDHFQGRPIFTDPTALRQIADVESGMEKLREIVTKRIMERFALPEIKPDTVYSRYAEKAFEIAQRVVAAEPSDPRDLQYYGMETRLFMLMVKGVDFGTTCKGASPYAVDAGMFAALQYLEAKKAGNNG